MPDSLGPLPPLAINGALLAMPLLPLLMGLGLSLLALGRRPMRVGRIWSVGPTLASTGLLGFLTAYVALGREPSMVTLGHGVTLVRVGWLDIGFDIAFDRLTGAFAVVGGSFFAGLLSWLGRDDPSNPRPLAPLALGNLASGAFFFAIMADAAPAFALGASASAFACAWVAARASARPRALRDFSHRALGDALLALGLVALSASFAQNADEGALPLRVVPVTRADDASRAGASRPSTGSLTMASLPGAIVRTDGSPSLASLTSPFVRNPVPAGNYRGHVTPGPGSPELPFGPSRIAEGSETRLVVAGPTVVFRSMQEQLALLAPAEGAAPGAAKVPPAAPKVGVNSGLTRLGITLVAAGILLRGAYVGAGRRRARGGGLGWLSAAPSALLGAYLLLRLSFAWAPPSASFAGLGFAAVLAASAGAFGARRPTDAAEALIALCLGLAVVSAGVGAPGAVFAFGLAPAPIAAALIARSSPLSPDLEPFARPLSRAWALPYALLSVVGVSSLVGRLPLASATGAALVVVLLPTLIVAAILAARVNGVASFTARGAATTAPQVEGVLLAAIATPFALLGAEPWFALARAKAPALAWASPSAALGAPRPLASLAATAALGLAAWFFSRRALDEGEGTGQPAPAAFGALDALMRKAARALSTTMHALFRAATAVDRGLWGHHRSARASGRGSGS